MPPQLKRLDSPPADAGGSERRAITSTPGRPWAERRRGPVSWLPALVPGGWRPRCDGVRFRAIRHPTGESNRPRAPAGAPAPAWQPPPRLPRRDHGARLAPKNPTAVAAAVAVVSDASAGPPRRRLSGRATGQHGRIGPPSRAGPGGEGRTRRRRRDHQPGARRRGSSAPHPRWKARRTAAGPLAEARASVARLGWPKIGRQSRRPRPLPAVAEVGGGATVSVRGSARFRATRSGTPRVFCNWRSPPL